ncbi:hypothetical protein OESDEN_00527 [Oesophagostomum dentatum]|uniref:Uncharacterized protein n=1 Tax=Oesophagostomum dentatum TaxID=61180 RepID=A0A0B1TTM1_OESDE|nr:hypothetical protein OESDEN_00527 [Oesophagostomum dentatum]
MGDEDRPLWERVLSLDWMGILEWIYDHLPFEDDHPDTAVCDYSMRVLLYDLLLLTVLLLCDLVPKATSSSQSRKNRIHHVSVSTPTPLQSISFSAQFPICRVLCLVDFITGYLLFSTANSAFICNLS